MQPQTRASGKRSASTVPLRVMAVLEALRRQSPRRVLLLGLLLLAVVAVVDRAAGQYFSFSMFYLLVVVLVSASSGSAYGVPLALLAAGVWSGLESASMDLEEPVLPLLWNTATRLAVLLVTVSLVATVVELAHVERARSRGDALTGLLNRRGFCDLADRELVRAGRSGSALTVLYLDVDGFKRVNDTDGHLAGDALLSDVARTLEARVRRTDTAARIGGDEFVVLLPETPGAAAEVAAERVSHGLDEMCREGSWPVRFSIGLVTFVEPPESVDELLSQADRLMYSAKRSGQQTGRSTVRSEVLPQTTAAEAAG